MKTYLMVKHQVGKYRRTTKSKTLTYCTVCEMLRLNESEKERLYYESRFNNKCLFPKLWKKLRIFSLCDKNFKIV